MISVDISSLQWFETVCQRACRYLELRGGGLGVETVLTKGTATIAMVALKLAVTAPPVSNSFHRGTKQCALKGLEQYW